MEGSRASYCHTDDHTSDNTMRFLRRSDFLCRPFILLFLLFLGT